jgi:hypothetical protein
MDTVQLSQLDTFVCHNGRNTIKLGFWSPRINGRDYHGEDAWPGQQPGSGFDEFWICGSSKGWIGGKWLVRF